MNRRVLIAILVSLIGHAGAFMMTRLAWQVWDGPVLPSSGSVLVPVEIVEIGPEVNVRALAVEVEEEAEAPEIAETSTPSDSSAAPTPTPRRPQPRNNDDDWMRDLRADLNDTSKERGRQQQEGTRADRDQRGAGLGTAERVTIEARVQALSDAHMRRCWRMPADLPEPERLIVFIEFDLNRNGTLNGQPRVVSPRNYSFDAPMRVAVDAALRAVRQCDPYPFPDDPIVGEHYQVWRTVTARFGPRQN